MALQTIDQLRKSRGPDRLLAALEPQVVDFISKALPEKPRPRCPQPCRIRTTTNTEIRHDTPLPRGDRVALPVVQYPAVP